MTYNSQDFILPVCVSVGVYIMYISSLISRIDLGAREVFVYFGSFARTLKHCILWLLEK